VQGERTEQDKTNKNGRERLNGRVNGLVGNGAHALYLKCSGSHEEIFCSEKI